MVIFELTVRGHGGLRVGRGKHKETIKILGILVFTLHQNRDLMLFLQEELGCETDEDAGINMKEFSPLVQ